VERPGLDDNAGYAARAEDDAVLVVALLQDLQAATISPRSDCSLQTDPGATRRSPITTTDPTPCAMRFSPALLHLNQKRYQEEVATSLHGKLDTAAPYGRAKLRAPGKSSRPHRSRSRPLRTRPRACSTARNSEGPSPESVETICVPTAFQTALMTRVLISSDPRRDRSSPEAE